MEPENKVFGVRHCYHLGAGKSLGAVLALEVGLCLAEQFGCLPLGKGIPVLLAVAIAGLLIIFLLASFVTSLLFSWTFQFGSRSLLVMVLVVAVPCSWLGAAVAQSRRQRNAVDSLKMLGCQIEHEPTVDGDTPWGLSRTSDQPAVSLPQSPLVRLLGPDFFADVVYVDHTVGSRFRPFADTNMESLRGFRRLRYLSLSFDEDLLAAMGSADTVSDIGMMNLAGLVELRQLMLCGCRTIGDAALGNLKQMSQLRRLALVDLPRISDAGLANIQGLRELRDLTISGTSVTGAAFENTASFVNLRQLDASGSPLSDAGIEHIARLGNLQALLLFDTPLTDAGCEHICRLTSLEILGLDGTKIGNDGLSHVKRLTNLRILTFANTQVADAGLEHLKGLRQLEQVGLDGTKVSVDGVRSLQGRTTLIGTIFVDLDLDLDPRPRSGE